MSDVSAWARTLSTTGPGATAPALRDPGVSALCGTVTIAGSSSSVTVSLQAAAWSTPENIPAGAWYEVPGASVTLSGDGAAVLGASAPGAAPVPVIVPAARYLRAVVSGGGPAAAVALTLTADDY